jgi:hypothetical protein
VFPAHYDRAWYSALAELGSTGWAKWEIEPRFSGAFYLSFSSAARAVYIAYEEWIVLRDHKNLATDYLICARVPTDAVSPTESVRSVQR